MTDPNWEAVDAYFEGKLFPADPVLEECLRASAAAGLPNIQVSPAQGRLLYLLAKTSGARRILEVGTLGGYSTICLARALPAVGSLVTLELDPKHAEVARANLARAGLAGKVEVVVGPALESLPKLKAEKRGPFDLFFLDADRPNNRAYVDWVLRLGRTGSILIVDNVVRRGEVADPTNTDPSVRGVREMIDALATEGRVSATAIQTVGKKGYDGFLLARIE
jgi:predicted O-methyltransferase YrrM